MVRLAYGVVAGRDLRVWAPGLDGVAVNATRATLAPGAAVVLGPRGSEPAAITAAVEELAALVTAGGLMAAGAGVEVGPGFRTARLAGGAGDRRDAMLAALRVLGPEGTARLGDRAGVLVALFGPTATKPVGVAASMALHDGRLGVLHLASAASNVLGPEQLERVLRLTGSDGLDRDAEGLASTLAEHLGRLLGPMAKPRRLALLLDLWQVVGAQRSEAARRQRLLDVQGREDRLAEVRARYQRLVDDQVVAQAAYDVGESTRPANLARWTPHPWHWLTWLNRTMHDALAATVLLRAAVAVAEHGLADGIALVRPQLATAPILLTRRDKNDASRRVVGLAGVPARPGAYVRELDEHLRPGVPMSPKTESFVRQRLARARDYGLVVLAAASELISAMLRRELDGLGEEWTCPHLRQWRDRVGYSAVRSPSDWEQPALRDGQGTALAQRLRERPEATPAELEQSCDLLWYADLADAVAQLNGHVKADVTFGEQMPTVDTDPPTAPVEPLRPADDSVALAVAGAAQLVDLGVEVSARARRWGELVDGLLGSTVVAEALTGSFAVPEPLRGRDGATLPGTDARLEIASDPHQLAEWSRYMGNCIAGAHYLQSAMSGTLVLVALRDPSDRILANVALYPSRSGWHLGEFRARFNADPDPALAEQVRTWVAALPPRPPVRRAMTSRPHGHGPVRSARRLQAMGDLRGTLVPLAADAVADQAVSVAVDVISHAGLGAPAGLAGITALRRHPRGDLDAALRSVLAAGTPDILTVWRATSVRPLATAVAGLDPALRERYGYLELLLGDGPLPAVPRRLARVPEIAEARSVELVARRLRRALGRLARAADPVLAPQVSRHADTGLLCALVLAVSTAATAPAAELTPITRAGEVIVPGYPEATLDDEAGPWRQATAAAEDLGAELDWTRPAPALVVPTGWLGRGGWSALWARAHRQR